MLVLLLHEYSFYIILFRTLTWMSAFCNLVGVIPIEIGNLHNLRVLSISNCSITGVIPRNIGNLMKLEVLHLGENNIHGNFLIIAIIC